MTKVNNNKKVPPSYNVVDMIGKFITAKKELEQTREMEGTKRAEIEADLKKHIISVNAQREFLEKYLKKEYKIRKKVTDHFFEILDSALVNGKDEVAIKTLESIENIVKESPLSGIMQLKESIANNSVIKI